ncbi:beta-ketoacyl synthase N-terminal-like domain-containing protein [Streptomyces sp. NPDC058807]|uniref:beta-ketoacyl synthase N-terminal-like domain-containing protein n=1 Tax=unclassified Streptomyces TaxID=2593676 RepID=UPI0036A86273
MRTDTMDPAEIRTLMEEQLRLSRQLRERIRELEEEKHAPLAVVGMGLRLPGGLDTPESYWDFLRGEGIALSGLPPERPGLRAVYDPTPGTPGRSYVDRAGFLRDIAHFDAAFFGISQREARMLDPQQRLLLETAWEALERAGIAVRRSDRLDVGVYLGMMASEYSERLEDRLDTSRIDPYYTTGGGLCFGAGRISYVMGFSGPVVSVDTACSSSMSALHLAVQGLRRGECRYALVCGSNLLLSANLMVSLCQTRALSPDGRSKSFLATADGYGRGEGVGAVALMRLADAEREGRPVLAVVRGSALNHDGAASGLTAPNGPAQQEVIRAALADAGVTAEEIGWVEAHGTGTVLGDPIEIGALDAVLGEAVRRRGVPLGVGSVKSRIGHLEAASGIAALIKAVLMLRHGEIPAAASDSDGELNPHIPWDDLSFTVPRRNRLWPAQLARRIVGINSFGMSGTNAHAVLEAYRPAASTAPADVPPRRELLTLSARDPQALAELTARVADRLRKADPAELPSLCHTLRVGRAPFAHRVAVTGTSPEQLADALTEALDEARRAPAGTAVRSVTLSAGSGGDDGLAAAVTALTGAFPGLARSAPDPAEPPARWLAGLLRGLGLRVDITTPEPHDRPAAGATTPAVLTWQAHGRTRTAPLVAAEPGRAPGLLQDALAALYRDGADPRMDGLCPPGTRLTGDLPTYPFQRRRHWVDEPDAGAVGEPGTTTGGAARARVPVPASRTRQDIAAYLEAELKDALQAPQDQSLDHEQSLLDAGGDSFISTLFITRVEENFAVGLSPEDLPVDLPMGELIGRLADDIAGSAGTDQEASA